MLSERPLSPRAGWSREDMGVRTECSPENVHEREQHQTWAVDLHAGQSPVFKRLRNLGPMSEDNVRAQARGTWGPRMRSQRPETLYVPPTPPPFCHCDESTSVSTCLLLLSSPGDMETQAISTLPQSLAPPGLLRNSLKGRPLGGGSGEGAGRQRPRNRLRLLAPRWLGFSP